MARCCHAALLLLVAILLSPAFSPASQDEQLGRAATLLNAGQTAEALTLLHDAERRLPDP
jgi:hypothetical protein